MKSIKRVGDVSEQIRGVTYAKEDASQIPRPGYIPILRAGNIEDAEISLGDLVYVPRARIADEQLVRQHDVLVATSSGSLDVVGKAAQATTDLGTAFGAFCKVLRPGPHIHPRYFGYFFRTILYRRRISQLAAGANINNLRNEHLDDLPIPVPSMTEQCRIADILDKADAIRRKRKEALSLIEELLRSAFLEMFGDPVTNPKSWDVKSLGALADIASGVAKGKKYDGQKTVTLPYMRVANVQDGHLVLDEVKTIAVSEDEGLRYRLKYGDVLLTEGGDPDKLGRGTVWRDEVSGCIHQNHIFRVRPSQGIKSEYLSAIIGSERGKRYFLRAAKQTTGIATINMTQLKAFPVLVPPFELQEKYVAISEKAELLRAKQRLKNAAIDELFSSLVQRAFRGGLVKSNGGGMQSDWLVGGT